ncbi:MAG: LUD domain-containing protein [Bacteroidales bacterium]|nr:LUD domain-containing protein [Bacteroidales bacterium]
MAYTSNKKYRKEISHALDDKFLQTALGNFTSNYPQSRENAFNGKNIEELIHGITDLKRKSVSHINELYSLFKQKATEHGAIIHLASDAEEANSIIEKIASEGNVRSIVKSKSMTSEEIHLNDHLISKGFEVVETDLGEWIIQLRHEGPSHMVMPAIHLSKGQVAETFSDETKQSQPEVIKTLVSVARKELRPRFLKADMGITGANFAIAGTGTIGIVTNEGNARLVTTLPRIHVALIGLEKLIETVDEALKILEVLPKNATGQKITSYITWITGRNECKSSADGKKEYHIVFLDNKRSEIANDKIFSDILNCIRCGACANVCPVYGHIGGHMMGHVYIGPVGHILTYFYHGIDNAAFLADNCINCLACKEVCAAGIDLPSLIKEIQIRINERKGRPVISKTVTALLKNRKMFHRFLKIAKTGQKPFTGNDGFIRHLPLILYKEHSFRTLPVLADEPLRDKWKSIKPVVNNPKLKIGIFAGCLDDFVYPEQVEAAIKLFAANNIESFMPEEQSCCGLPLMMTGDKKNSKIVALRNVMAFKDGGYDAIVTLCASCASFLKGSYPEMEGFNDEEKEQITRFAGKITDFRSFVNKYCSFRSNENVGKTVTYHAPCHLIRGLNLKESAENLITKAGYKFVRSEFENQCCGFGGTYTVKYPEISAAQLEKKLDAAEKTGAEILLTECPGCIMQLRGGADKQKRNISVLHLSEILNCNQNPANVEQKIK